MARTIFAALMAVTLVSMSLTVHAQAPAMGGPAMGAPATGVAPLSPAAPSGVMTSRGPGLVTGSAGATQSVMIPGSPVGGMMLNNGNGTSTIMVPGAPSQVVPTPR
jgi:hypothetical protein